MIVKLILILVMVCALYIAQPVVSLNTSLPFDMNDVKSALWLSAAAYCPRRMYKTRRFTAYSSGFVVTDVFFNHRHDISGFVGYNERSKTISIVYRGTHSRRNWLFNIDESTIRYHSCNDCEIHRGFWNTYHSIAHKSLRSVVQLHRLLPTYEIVATGHSLGGACATFVAADLTLRGLNTTLYTFGAPRLGNEAAAIYFSSTLTQHYRLTHHKDPVPHMPSQDLGYMHMDDEVYEDNHRDIVLCTGYEDPRCSMQHHETNVRDHMYYLGLYMHCDAVSDDYR